MEYIGVSILEGLLLTIVFLAFMVELKTGGMGIGAFLGIIAAAVFFGFQYSIGMLDLSVTTFFLGGIFCLVLELLTPAIGLFAAMGAALIMYSLYQSLGGTVEAAEIILGAAAAAVLIFLLLVKKLPDSGLWKRLVLFERSTEENGYVSAAPQDYLLGKQGIVLTDLRPAGTAVIEGRNVDVVSEGAFLNKGEKIEVISVNGSRVVVKKIEKMEA